MAIEAPSLYGPRTAETTNIPDDPTARLGWEVNIKGSWWSFVPTYYPDRFVQSKDRELNRDGRQCGGENVSLKAIKNREFHAKGIVLASEIPVLQKLLDHDGQVDLISPLTPSGGMECEIKHAELGEKAGFDAIEREWQFNYSLDFVSTGHDEYESGQNAIVSAIIGSGGDQEFGEF